MRVYCLYNLLSLIFFQYSFTNISVIETPRSSTVFENKVDLYGPALAVDGKISSGSTGFFMTDKLHYQWLELPLKVPKRLIGVKITNRKDLDTSSLFKLEIRAGGDQASGSDKLTHNEKVGYYNGPAAKGETFVVWFDKTVLAKYVTLQLTYGNIIKYLGWLYINEVVLIPGS